MDRCARCGVDGAEEFCWACHAWLCAGCWDLFGHCGHPEADEVNRQGREGAGKALRVSEVGD
jgi:hypothetical protein